VVQASADFFGLFATLAYWPLDMVSCRVVFFRLGFIFFFFWGPLHMVCGNSGTLLPLKMVALQSSLDPPPAILTAPINSTRLINVESKVSRIAFPGFSIDSKCPWWWENWEFVFQCVCVGVGVASTWCQPCVLGGGSVSHFFFELFFGWLPQ